MPEMPWQWGAAETSRIGRPVALATARPCFSVLYHAILSAASAGGAAKVITSGSNNGTIRRIMLDSEKGVSDQDSLNTASAGRSRDSGRFFFKYYPMGVTAQSHPSGWMVGSLKRFSASS